jgi:hypothetical protein
MTWPFKPKPVCHHKWVVLDKHVEQSPYEKAGANRAYLKGEFYPSFFEATYICILKCTECGAIDKTVEAMPRRR